MTGNLDVRIDSAEVHLSGTHDYTGATTIIDDGLLILDGANLSNTSLEVQNGVLGGNGRIGGAVTFVNPEPLALFADLITAGEGESLVPDLVDALRGGGTRGDNASSRVDQWPLGFLNHLRGAADLAGVALGEDFVSRQVN